LLPAHIRLTTADLATPLAGAVGGWLASTVDPNVMRWILGVSFIAMQKRRALAYSARRWTGLKLLLDGLEGRRVRKRFSLPSVVSHRL
jgi:hypothetical protein